MHRRRPSPNSPAVYPPGEGWPTDEQRLLLQAALLPGNERIDAWREWRALGSGAGRLHREAGPLMALLRRNLPRHETEVYADVFREACKAVAAANLVLFGRARPVLQALNGAGFKIMLLKGSALAGIYYLEQGLRPVADIDLLVTAGQAAEVIAWLQQRGWHPGALNWQSFTATCREAALSHVFRKEGRVIDLHWHLLHECRRADDDEFWAAAVPYEFQGIQLLALHPADQLLHVCVHGARRPSPSPLLWLADVAMILRHREPAVDWERLVVQSRRRRLTLPVCDALSYVREHLHAPVPESALDDLAGSPTSRMERIEYRCKRRRPAGNLPLLWFDYMRWTDAPRFPRSILGFVPYLYRVRRARRGAGVRPSLGTVVRRMFRFLGC